jgi:hypothetical protein
VSDFTVFLETVREWSIREDWADSLVTSFVRTAESELSRNMRVKEMVTIADAQVEDSRTKLPLDWRELDFVKINGGKPILYMPVANFNAQVNGWKNHYTIIGNTLQLGADIPAPDGLAVEISYYAAAPKFETTNTWLQNYYYDIFLQKTLAVGLLYSQKMEDYAALSALVDNLIGIANEEHKISNFSGSPLKRPKTGRTLG